MERHEDAVFALSKLNLDYIEKTIHEAYHQKGPGRPLRSPQGIFKALMTKRLRQIPIDRELPATVERPHAEDDLRHRGTGEVLPPLRARAAGGCGCAAFGCA